MRRILALALVLALVGISVPTTSLAAAKPQGNGQVSGTAKDQAGQPLANASVRLRNVATGQMAATGTTTGTGAFSFTGLAAGNYVVEVVDAAGRIIATSTSLTLGGSTMTISGVVLTSSAAGAAGGAVAGGSFFKSTAGILLLGAAGAGAVVAVVATTGDESPKK